MLTRIVLGLLLVIVLAVVLGWSYQQIQSRNDMAQFPPPGDLHDVDGVLMHLDCRGEGEPTILLESGLGNSSIAWYPIIHRLAATTRVCAYDRPGLGWSEPVTHLNQSPKVAARLHGLLKAAGVEGPFVLGGWSAGGVYIREFQHQFPSEVLGMVFVDSSHEQQGNRLPQLEGGGDNMLGVCALLQPLGAIRLLGSMDQLYEQGGVPVGIRPAMVATSNASHFCSTVQREGESFEADVKGEAPTPVGDIPLVVLTQGKPYDSATAFGLTEEQFNAFRAVWNELQQELAALSPKGQWVVASNAGHSIQIDDPELVIEAFNNVLRQLNAQ